MKKSYGTLEVIYGPMFSGKTNLLLARVKKSTQRAQLFKPAHDTRYQKNAIVSHDGKKMKAIVVRTAKDILGKISMDTTLVAIDEAQFFGKALIPVTHAILKNGQNVIVSGLSVRYDQKPFSPAPELAAEAEKVIKLTARCAHCGKPAVFHARTATATSKNMLHKLFVGGAESYKPLCRACIKKERAMLE